jgi:MoxR-like ATPase
MKPSMLFEALLALIGERVPLHIWGACGVGKSQIVAQVAEHLEGDFLTFAPFPLTRSTSGVCQGSMLTRLSGPLRSTRYDR